MRGADVTPGRDLLPDLNAAFILESDRPEWAFLKGERLWAGATSQAAAVAQLGQHRIGNPVNSNMICVIEGIACLQTAGNDRFELRFDAVVGVPALGAITARDTRWGTVNRTVATFVDSVDVAAATGTVVSRVFTNLTERFVFPIVLAPGDSIFIVNVNLNVITQVSSWGYERPLESYEQ